MTPPLVKNLFRFLFVGGLNTGLVYLAFKGLLALHVHYLLAAAVGWAVGVVVSYILNRNFTFEVGHAADAREFGAFVGAYLFQLAVGQFTYWLLMGVLRLNADIAFFCNLVFTTIISFAFMRWVVFRRRPRESSGHV
jgi:putative flippase GtrA